MKKILLPILLLLFGTGSGVAAALFLAPADHGSDEATAADCTPEDAIDAGDVPLQPAEDAVDEEKTVTDAEGQPAYEYARMNNQFVVPVVEGGRVTALMVMSLSVEVPVGVKDVVFAAEPKLRDVFLQVLFDHANIGGFNGTFTNASNMRVLRRSLKDAARRALGPQVTDVLIVDIARQDL